MHIGGCDGRQPERQKDETAAAKAIEGEVDVAAAVHRRAVYAVAHCEGKGPRTRGAIELHKQP